MDKNDNKTLKDPTEKNTLVPKIIRGGLDLASIIPGVGGVFSAISSAWSEHDQDRANDFFKAWLKMLSDEIKEQEKTFVEILMRLDLQDDKINSRIHSPEYQSLMKKAFRDWAAAESEEKRKLARNILSNAAATQIVTDDVIKMFLDWLRSYSELHFQVISSVYNTSGITRGGIWKKLGKPIVKEDSADADLYKLLIRDLSTGGIIRQHVERDYDGNVILKTPGKQKGSTGQKTPVSAFDDNEPYELTQLGQQFVHYAMTELPLKIEAPESD